MNVSIEDFKRMRPDAQSQLLWDQELSEEFMTGIMPVLDEDQVSRLVNNQKLSQTFISKNWNLFSNDVKSDVVLSQVLSMKFIQQIWENISDGLRSKILKQQKLEQVFIESIWPQLSLEQKKVVGNYQKLSTNFVKKHTDELQIDKDNWLYKDAEFKKQQVAKTGLYEMHKDYFVAYKGVLKSRHSTMGLQYKYEDGKSYDTHADFFRDEHGFGFSVATKERALDWMSRQQGDDHVILRVKIPYHAVARVSHSEITDIHGDVIEPGVYEKDTGEIRSSHLFVEGDIAELEDGEKNQISKKASLRKGILSVAKKPLLPGSIYEVIGDRDTI